VLVWDPPGAGRSGHPLDNHYSVHRFAEDLGAVLTLAGERPPLLVGHGLGALPVFELCRNRSPRGLAGVAILNGANASPLKTNGESGFMRWLRWPVLQPLLWLDVWFSPLVRVASWASYLNGTAQLAARSSAFGEDPTRAAVDQTAYSACRQAPSVQSRALSAALAEGGKGQLEISAPLLVIAGERDALVDVEACRRTAESVPDGELLVVEAAGHAGPLEEPSAYATAIVSHARRAFNRTAADRERAAAALARARRLAAAPEPRSWISEPEREGPADEWDEWRDEDDRDPGRGRSP
jgi:pimeloyl-ACP methyl ester carboxylesterase